MKHFVVQVAFLKWWTKSNRSERRQGGSWWPSPKNILIIRRSNIESLIHNYVCSNNKTDKITT